MAGIVSILDSDVGGVACAEASNECLADLHLDRIIAAVIAGHDDGNLTRIFSTPLREVAAVRYRQQVFRDLEADETRLAIEDFADGMRAVRNRLHTAANVWHPLQQQGWLIAAIESYCEAVLLLADQLFCVRPRSSALRKIAQHITRYAEGETFGCLVAETQSLRERLGDIRYLVHIDGLRVRVESYSQRADYSSAVAETFARFTADFGKDYRVNLPEFKDMNHVEEQILVCVSDVYPDVFAMLSDFCRRHAEFVEPNIARFEHEIQFYLSYLAFMGRFGETGLTFSYPEVTDEPGNATAEDVFDLALALKTLKEDRSPVPNSFALSGRERIFVVTGPNQGGKTTLARTIGQCAYLASLGCPVPAGSSRLTLPDQIFTHFERQEEVSTLHGKLDDELVRIHDILSRATGSSIIIMNESFSSTTADDALLIGGEVLERIIALNCIAVYVTFIDELSTLDPACVSMVGEVAEHDPTHRTFRFSRRPADGRAYAAALAEKYGLTHELLKRRVAQ